MKAISRFMQAADRRVFATIKQIRSAINQQADKQLAESLANRNSQIWSIEQKEAGISETLLGIFLGIS